MASSFTVLDAQHDENDSMTCNACNHRITSFNDRLQHYKTEWHRYNVKRRCAGLDSITNEAFELKLTALRNSKQTTVIKCHACSKIFKSQTSFDQHVQSNKHKKQVVKYEAAIASGAVPLPSEENKEDAVVEAEDDIDAEDSKTKPTESQQQNEEEEEEEEDDDEGEGIPLKQCMFCNMKFEELQPSLDHMLKQHGFFIPFVELLHDLDGLLSYLGEKIGVGHVCLYCNGRGRARYPNTRAVQQHMMAKDHCKIRFEEDPDDEEFLDFYNFPQDDEEQETAAGSTKTRVTDITDAGELILSNGTRIGHRSLRVYYRQDLKPTPTNALIATEPSGISPAVEAAAADPTGKRALTVISNSERSHALLAIQDKYKVDAIVKQHRASEVERTKFVQRLQQRRMKIGVKANHFRFHLRAQINM